MGMIGNRSCLDFRDVSIRLYNILNMESSQVDIFSILRIPSGLRSSQHIEVLMRLTQNVQFFTKLSSEHNFTEIHRDCCKVMTLEEYSESDFIMNFGDKGEKFYIILTGSVSIKTPVNKRIKISKASVKKLKKVMFQTSESELPEEKPNKGGKMTIRLRKYTENTPYLNTEEKELLDYFKSIDILKVSEIFERVKNAETEVIQVELGDFIEIGILNEGTSFGELALIKGKERSASVQAREKSSFLVMNQKDFIKILGAVSEKKLANVVKFLQRVQYFQAWSKSALTKIAYYFEPIKYKKNQIIYKESDSADGLYFIKDGEVVIEKRIQNKPAEIFSIFSSSPKNFTQKPQLKTKPDNSIKIIIKSRFESFGGFELFNQQTRFYSSICASSTCEVLFMNRSNFLNRVPYLDLIKPIIIEENDRITQRYYEIIEKDKKQQENRNKTPTLLDRSEENVLTSLPKFIKISSSCVKNLPKLSKSPAGRFLRHLTKNEIEEAVNGRSSCMRIYGSRTHMINSSFGNYLKRQLVPINLQCSSILPN